jgi:hypothetical protein
MIHCDSGLTKPLAVVVGIKNVRPAMSDMIPPVVCTAWWPVYWGFNPARIHREVDLIGAEQTGGILCNLLYLVE